MQFELAFLLQLKSLNELSYSSNTSRRFNKYAKLGNNFFMRKHQFIVCAFYLGFFCVVSYCLHIFGRFSSIRSILNCVVFCSELDKYNSIELLELNYQTVALFFYPILVLS